MLKRMLFGGCAVALMALLPSAIQGQFSVAAAAPTGITCHDECYQAYCGGHYVGAGGDPGGNSNVCSVGGCSSGGCLSEEDAEDDQVEMAAAVDAILSAQTSDEFVALVANHGDRLLLNKDRNEVVVLAGCTLAPVAVVSLGGPQMERLSAVASTSLGDYLAARAIEKASQERAVDSLGF